MSRLALAASLLAALLPCTAAAKESPQKTAPRLSSETFTGLELRSIGPALMSGRIADIAVDPTDQSTWYVAVGSGGVWKTTNAGTTWTPIFDDQSVYSIGCVTVDPRDRNVVWVGTGENVGGRHVGYGNGVYKSLDGGETWQNMGLEKSEHIGKILVDPSDSRVVYVASQGPLWSKGGDRGLFKTTDGGATWAQVLGAGEYTGVNDVVMDPRDPQVLYASTHQRFRNVAALINGGPESGIHKSHDGGATWRQLNGGKESGLPEDDMGKIGLAISPQNPDVVYATIELAQRKGGFYRSVDAGGTWEKRNDYISGATGPHYYQEIFASPHRFDRVYQMDFMLHITEDGGATFRPVGEEHKHVDNHAMAFDPSDPDYLLVGCDGGLYQSWDLGKHWSFVANLPVTQFYKVAVDDDEPFYNVYGGTQDNNTQGGPSQTLNVHGIRNSDWFITLFGDGHQPATEPGNPDIVYSQWQEGSLVRYDRPTGEIVYIQPQPGPDEPAERWNWDSPILVSPHDPARIYFASQRVWRSDDRGDSWRPISGDLSRGQDRLTLPMMGRVWSYDAVWDLWAMSNFANITSLSESPLVEGLLYAGTDDGLIQVSEDGGASWRLAGSLPGVPDGAFVNDLKADLHAADTVYVALDNHKAGDFRPFLLRSTDRGRTWSSIAGDPKQGGLPDRHLVWRLVQDHVAPGLLFAGTEFGLFFSVGGGDSWIELQGGAPTIAFRDLAIQRRENDLVGATFGRGFYVLDDYSPLRQISEEALAREATLFPVKDTLWYIQRRTLGPTEKAVQGASFFTAPNPPFGAVFTYYLREDLKSRKKERQDREGELAKAGDDTPYPGWEELHREQKEEEPKVLLTVRDAAGEIVRHLAGPATSGFHRVAWDLRYPSSAAWRSPEQEEEDFFPTQGPLAAPGAYSVTLAKRVEDELTALGESQSFTLEPLADTVLPRTDPVETLAFLRQVEELRRVMTAANAILGETEKQLASIRSMLLKSTAEASLHQEVRSLEGRLYDLRQRLQGDRLKSGLGEPSPPSVQDRLVVIDIGNRISTYGPTPHHRVNFTIANDELKTIRPAIEELLRDTRTVEEKLEAERVPWTPGRGLPSG